jgi:hypothetical protein
MNRVYQEDIQTPKEFVQTLVRSALSNRIKYDTPIEIIEINVGDADVFDFNMDYEEKLRFIQYQAIRHNTFFISLQYMIEVCDPDADLDVLKKLIKMNTGHTIKLTKEQICQVYNDIKAEKLPLPPLIMSSNKTYLVDKNSPLKPNDYDILFDSSSKRNDIKIVARKVGLKQLDQMTKSQMIDSIGKRLRYMKIHEPVKIGTRRTTTESGKKYLTTQRCLTTQQ